MNKKNYISFAKRAASIQINELSKIKKVFNSSFAKAVELILSCKGQYYSGVFVEPAVISRNEIRLKILAEIFNIPCKYTFC